MEQFINGAKITPDVIVAIKEIQESGNIHQQILEKHLLLLITHRGNIQEPDNLFVELLEDLNLIRQLIMSIKGIKTK